ncbi:MAG: HAMP domain-containing protein, partial [Anaerolineae bacterium]
MFSSIWWRLTAPYILILLAATLGLTLYLSAEVRDARLEDRRAQLLDEARLMADSLQPTLIAAGGIDATQLDRQIDTWSGLIDQRVTLIDPDGTVLGDSDANYREMENHLYRPEIQQALAEGMGTATRYSQTLRKEVMYAALAVHEGEQILGFIRVALPLEKIETEVGQLNRTLLITGSLAGLVAVLLTTFVASRTLGPIRRLTETVERMAAGDLSGRLLATTDDEIGQLTRSFNHMAEQLQEKVATLALEQSRLAAVLEHMADGVIITDERGLVVSINTAAARILRYDEERAIGMRFAQVAYSHRLIDLWNRCYETQEEQNETIETALYGNFLHAVVTPLRGSDPPRYLIMLQDLTHIRRLETVRRDFISNISHELRTPLASLSLLIETLRDGAIEDPTAAHRFLSHMETEMAALTQMVEELLELSRIES